jgi:hypothetical protein
MVVNHPDNICRIYSSTEENVELNIARRDDRIAVGMEDLDDGNTVLWITVKESDILAALALTKTTHVSQD